MFSKRISALLPIVLSSCIQPPVDEPAEEVQLAQTSQALGGIEGTMEYAIDAPWRIEPVRGADGALSWGAIPIQISVHDGAQVPLDGSDLTFGNFCELSVEQEDLHVSQRYTLRELEEIEQGGRWRVDTPAPQPDHGVCRPAQANGFCAGFENLGVTEEWHAQAWFAPRGTLSPGRDIPLKLTMQVTKSPLKECSEAGVFDRIELINYATVHLGEAPLPRFDNRWLYGDLHYHSQGTDNEGESAYNYRGVIRAMGALGLDFVLASEHASNANQIIDADIDTFTPELNRDALRDMSDQRFKFLLDQLHRARTGINTSTAFDGPGDSFPQAYLSHGVVPQIFLGGEIDAVPETDQIGPNAWYVSYGDGLYYNYLNLCGGWNSLLKAGAPCPGDRLYTPTATGSLIKDVQGLNDFYFGREHLIYMPKRSTDVNGFVASNTSLYGGATRRLADALDGQAPLLPEIARKGYAFLAHPLNGSGGEGGMGPDGPPWSDFMLEKAWSSEAILGLQFWNEPVHLHTSIQRLPHDIAGGSPALAGAYEDGYDFKADPVDGIANLADTARKGFARGRFELAPYYDLAQRSYEKSVTEEEFNLHHGAAMWDHMLLKGIDPQETRKLSWLPASQPRKFFMAAGSDAHGDLNYHRSGYMRGTEAVDDDAIAKARNLVFVGSPSLKRDEDIPAAGANEPAMRHSQEQVVSAIASGNYATTDGPALRVVIDRNRNGKIDDSDTPMGGTFELHGQKVLPLLVEWASTPEFGAVDRIDLYVGVTNGYAGMDAEARIYAPANEGPRNGADLPGGKVTDRYTRAGLKYRVNDSGYWIDPGEKLRIDLGGAGSMSGVKAVNLPLDVYEAANSTLGDRFFVRSFAETVQADAASCSSSSEQRHLKGACIRHYAYSNPIWAVTLSDKPCSLALGGADRDGDHLPDECDDCPDTQGTFCPPHLRNVELMSADFGDPSGWDAPSHSSTIHYQDLNRDGLDDVCGRGYFGIVCALANDHGFDKATLWTSYFRDEDNWAAPEYYSTISYPDLNGDGMADVCGRGVAAMYCVLSTGNKFDGLVVSYDVFADARDWNQPKYYSSLQFQDVNGDDTPDACALGAAGIFCATSDGHGKFTTETQWTDSSVFRNLADKGPGAYTNIRFPKINGDKMHDVCAYLVDNTFVNIYCATSNGKAFKPETFVNQGSGFGSAFSLGDPAFYSTIEYVDVSGDGKADVCGRIPGHAPDGGIACAISIGSSFGPLTQWTQHFSSDEKWSTNPTYYGTIRYADINGDGKVDVCGRRSDGVQCAVSNGSQFVDFDTYDISFTDAAGFLNPEFSSTFAFANIFRDGIKRLCVRGYYGIICQK